MAAPAETDAPVRRRPPAGARRLPPARVDGARPAPWRLLLAGAIGLAALSLLGPSAPTYDPWAWLIWGRQITDGDLVTVAGPSWKPLPVMATTLFSLLDDDAAPTLWLLVARTGGLLAIALAFRVARRLAGPAAGVLAAVFLLLATDFFGNAARGDSEGLLVAFSLWAIERHLDGRRHDAFAFGVAAALLRPETWIFLALYGLWLVWSDWRRPERWRTAALVVGSGVAVLLLWFVPEWLGSGDLLRGASRAREPVEDSPGQAAFPFLAVFGNSAEALIVPVYAGAVLAVPVAVAAWRDEGRRVPLAIGVIATVYMLEVAVLAQGGFTGNLRYVALPSALLCVLAGIGWTGAYAAVGRRHGRRRAHAAAAVAIVAAAPFVVDGAARFGRQLEGVHNEAKLHRDLHVALERVGGAEAVRRCGPVSTGPFQTQLVAWHLEVPSRDIDIRPRRSGTVLGYRDSKDIRTQALAFDRRMPLVASTDKWIVRSTCLRRDA